MGYRATDAWGDTMTDETNSEVANADAHTAVQALARAQQATSAAAREGRRVLRWRYLASGVLFCLTTHYFALRGTASNLVWLVLMAAYIAVWIGERRGRVSMKRKITKEGYAAAAAWLLAFGFTRLSHGSLTSLVIADAVTLTAFGVAAWRVRR